MTPMDKAEQAAAQLWEIKGNHRYLQNGTTCRTKSSTEGAVVILSNEYRHADIEFSADGFVMMLKFKASRKFELFDECDIGLDAALTKMSRFIQGGASPIGCAYIPVVELSISLDFVDGNWEAHCLDFDVISARDSIPDAVKSVRAQAMTVILADAKSGESSEWRRAPEEFWEFRGDPIENMTAEPIENMTGCYLKTREPPQ